jgi:hypothetical protein
MLALIVFVHEAGADIVILVKRLTDYSLHKTENHMLFLGGGVCYIWFNVYLCDYFC